MAPAGVPFLFWWTNGFLWKPAPAGGYSAALALRSNVVGTCGSPTNAPSQNAVQRFVVDSVCAAAFFHRGIIPLLTLFFSASGSQKTAVTPLEDSGRCHSACRSLRGDQFPGGPRWLSGQAGIFCPLTALSQRNLTPPANPPHFPGLPRNCSPQGHPTSQGTPENCSPLGGVASCPLFTIIKVSVV